MLLVYPVAGKDMTTPSYVANADAKPLNKPMMQWFVKNTFATPDGANDPRIDLVVGFEEHAAIDAPVVPDADLDAAPVVPDAAKFTCNDGVCDGHDGETCGCGSDCDTQMDVCGNGACDPDEDSASCETDCGPAPWPFTDLEAQMLAAVNTARTGGIVCPGDTAPRTAAAVAATTDAQETVRVVAWEYAHDPRSAMGQVTCNGRTLISILQPSGFPNGIFIQTSFDPTMAVARVVTDPDSCTDLMEPAHTLVAIGAAHDLTNGYILFLK